MTYAPGGGQYNASLPILGTGQFANLQLDASGRLITNPRLLTTADIVTVQNTTFGQLFTSSANYDGQGNPLASFSPTGGTNLLKSATADTRYGYLAGTGNTISANGNSGDFDTKNLRYLALDVNVAGTITGTTPTLAFFLDRKGSDGIYYQVAALTPTYTTTIGANSWNIGPGLPVNIVLGVTMRLRWVVGGTTPVYNGTSINVYQQT